MRSKHFFIVIAAMCFFYASCSSKKQKSIAGGIPTAGMENKSVCKIKIPAREKFKTGDVVDLGIDIGESGIAIDSVQFFADGNILGKIVDMKLVFGWDTRQSRVGKIPVKVIVWLAGKKQCEDMKKITLLSDIEPVQYSFDVVKRFPHDPIAYTQGLLIEAGVLYEGTGQWGASSVRKIRLETGEVLQSCNLPDEFFGEGICILNNELFEITWRSHVGFVYEKESFKLLRRVSYPTEGWGLTTDGKSLIMSDGTNMLYYLYPESFTEIKRIEVYDQKGPVRNLNELEYINGEIYANVYLTSYIVKINPETGKVTGKIDMDRLIPEAFRGDGDRVPNGIAYDKDYKRLLVTGKMWPELIEVRLKKMDSL